jgi:hypothetical protein
VAVGTIGSLATLSGSDEAGGKLTPRLAAKYNGLKHVIRPTHQFSVQPLDPVYDAVTRGAHSSSWVRIEDGKATLLALRMQRLDGGRGISEFGGIVFTTASVVVASKTQDGLGRTDRLAVVPFGEGTLRLHLRSQASVVEITEHYLGGQYRLNRLDIRNGPLAIPLREDSENASLVEWIEIKIEANRTR